MNSVHQKRSDLSETTSTRTFGGCFGCKRNDSDFSELMMMLRVTKFVTIKNSQTLWLFVFPRENKNYFSFTFSQFTSSKTIINFFFVFTAPSDTPVLVHLQTPWNLGPSQLELESLDLTELLPRTARRRLGNSSILTNSVVKIRWQALRVQHNGPSFPVGACNFRSHQKVRPDSTLVTLPPAACIFKFALSTRFQFWFKLTS